jgi:hypothetical protein
MIGAWTSLSLAALALQTGYGMIEQTGTTRLYLRIAGTEYLAVQYSTYLRTSFLCRTGLDSYGPTSLRVFDPVIHQT